MRRDRRVSVGYLPGVPGLTTSCRGARRSGPGPGRGALHGVFGAGAGRADGGLADPAV